MPVAKRGLVARLALVSIVLLMACSAFFLSPARSAKATLVDLGYPWAAATTVPNGYYEWGYTTCPSDDSNCMILYRKESDGTVYGESDPYGYFFRNCTSFVAWKLVSLGVNSSYVKGLGNGGDWYDNAANKTGLTRGTTPQVGDAAVIPSSTPGFGGYGHVAYVDKVNPDGTIEIQQSNWDLQGDQDQRTVNPSQVGFTEFVHFGPLMTNPPTGITPTPMPSTPTIITRSPTTLNVIYTIGGSLVNQWWDSSTSVWVRQSWSVNATGRPAVALRNNGQDMTVFYRTTSGGIDQLYMSSGIWNTPSNLIPGEVWSDPAAASIDSNHQTVAWVDIHGALKQRTWDNAAGGWQGITTIMAADVVSHPVLTARSATAMDGFVVKSNQNLVHFSWGSSGWAWSDWTAGAIGSPRECNLSDGAMDGVYRKNIGYLEDRYWDWRYWAASMATDPAAAALNGTGYAVYGETGSNLVVRNLTSGYSNSVFGSIDKGYTPSITTRNGALETAFWASDGSLKHLQIDPGSLVATVSETITQKA